VPETHFLEAWGDARSYDGTVSIVQPLIEPLYQSHSPYEFLAVFSAQYDQKPYDILRTFWQGHPTGSVTAGAAATPAATPNQQTANTRANAIGTARPVSSPSPTTNTGPAAAAASAGGDFENTWRRWVHDGFIPNSALPTRSVTASTSISNSTTQSQPSSGGFEIIFRADPTIYDGRFANNGWLQELPKPLTKITWDNAALLSPNTARQLGLDRKIGEMGGDIYVDTINLTYQGRTLTAIPTWITPGQPDNVITVHLGYGRRVAGRVARNIGFDAYQLRTADSPWFGSGAQVQRATATHQVANTQIHFLMENRDIFRSYNVGEEENSSPESEKRHEPAPDETLYDPKHWDYKNQGKGYAWGMAIDLNSCVGCNACTIACQAENNIPVVGKQEVARSREMHWIRVDTYFQGEQANTPERTHFMPVPCMHCENAPCEPVCPVHATVHSAEGLNDMVYNRCVGTKYCSNNCPYKVRRFNFFLYQDWETPTYQLMRNPDVSVRSRGVMEKCTYCVQRIQEAKIQSELEGRKVRDGEIVTACQAACATNAIVFGDINDPNSIVSKVKSDKRNYELLSELNTRPRTSYLADLRNPNPEIHG
jgi:molybdopterin-containing oxidoreductase family iron-sulfur binding subunit